MVKAVGSSLSPVGAVVNNASISWDLAKVKTVAASVFKGAFAGMLAGAAVGAGTGAAIGFTATLLGGGIGALPGAIIGAIIGGGIGAIAGGIYGFRSGREEVLRLKHDEQNIANSAKSNPSNDAEKQVDSGWEADDEGDSGRIEKLNSSPKTTFFGVVENEGNRNLLIAIVRAAISENRLFTESEKKIISEAFPNIEGRDYSELKDIMDSYYSSPAVIENAQKLLKTM